jgi:hypothetical protein
MKVLIGTNNIAGLINYYKAGFESQGHQVTTAVVNNINKFYSFNFDYDLTQLYFQNLFTEVNKRHFHRRIIRKFRFEINYFLYKRFVKKLIDDHDLILILWQPFLRNCFDLKYARKRNKKIISLFVGSDVRYFDAFSQEFNIKNWSFPEVFKVKNIKIYLSYIRNCEKLADLIYSVPDQSGIQLRPYYHLQIPLDINKFSFCIPKNEIPILLHAPSQAFLKGTDIIEETLNQLRNEGLKFEYIRVKDLSNDQLMRLLTKADILVDEIVFHGPGILSFEAMLSGCAVATKYLETSPKNFKPPICNINSENIYEKLKELISNKEQIIRFAEEGRKYAIQNNSHSIVVKNILRDLEIERKFDYYPIFLRNSYVPKNKIDTNLINHWTKKVNNTDWYRSSISKGNRMGLKF